MAVTEEDVARLRQALAEGAQMAAAQGFTPHAPGTKVRMAVFQGTPLEEVLDAEVLQGPVGAQLFYFVKLVRKPVKAAGWSEVFVWPHREMVLAPSTPSP